jgi:hypothetical protein
LITQGPVVGRPSSPENTVRSPVKPSAVSRERSASASAWVSKRPVRTRNPCEPPLDARGRASGVEPTGDLVRGGAVAHERRVHDPGLAGRRRPALDPRVGDAGREHRGCALLRQPGRAEGQLRSGGGAREESREDEGEEERAHAGQPSTRSPEACYAAVASTRSAAASRETPRLPHFASSA